MPGIKLACIKVAAPKLRPFSLALLALFFSYPVVAAESRARIQTLEWSTEIASAALNGDPAGEAGQDDVWQRIRNGFKIEDAAAQNPLVAVHESWYVSRPEYLRRIVERSRRYLYHIVQ